MGTHKITLTALRNACHLFIGKELVQKLYGEYYIMGHGIKTRIENGILYVLYELNERG